MLKLDIETLSKTEFANLGGQEIAYIKQLSDKEAKELAATMGADIGDAILYAVHAADGTRMAVTDDRGEAVANAWKFGLTPVTLH